MLDLKIVGGLLVDGTGEAAAYTTIGVRNGRIVSVGATTESATQTVDADGALVTPGFVDVHTHYDGQATWDAELAPSALHGVTTAVMGNCGIGFAPVRPEDHARVIELMEGVEDIPGAALTEGIDFTWESFEQYMDALAAKPRTIDIAAQLPHDALRMYVMGARGTALEAATAADLARMQELVHSAIKAGAVGFSTGRTDNHRSIRGEVTPASEASGKELIALASALGKSTAGVMQAVSDFDMAKGEERFGPEFDLLDAMAAAAPGKKLSISLMQRDQDATQWQRILCRIEQANARGAQMRAQVAPRGIGVLVGLETTFHPFMGFPSYKVIAQKPLRERVRAMRDPVFRARLLSERSEALAGDGSAVPPLVDILLSRLDAVSLRLFRLGATPSYEPSIEESIYAQARARNHGPLDEIYDALLEQDGRALLYFPIYNYTEFSLDNVRTMLLHPDSVMGLGDAGAHVGTICDSSYPSFTLGYWGRDRKHGQIPVEWLVKKMALDTANLMGFADRGSLKLGMRADINILSLPDLALETPELRADLPAGGKRLLQRTRGIRHTFVRGIEIQRNGVLTGNTPGGLLRSR